MASALALACVATLKRYWGEALPEPRSAARIFEGLDRDSAARLISRAARLPSPPTASQLGSLAGEMFRPIGLAGIRQARQFLTEAQSA